MTRKQDPKLASARAYFRLAAKASKAGNFRLAESYRSRADRLVREHQRQREFIRRTFGS